LPCELVLICQERRSAAGLSSTEARNGYELIGRTKQARGAA
jgi:hypothetical protein